MSTRNDNSFLAVVVAMRTSVRLTVLRACLVRKALHYLNVISITGAEVPPLTLPNKAGLPVGIGNVRPHLENVDNVPLLVSLFTDCVREATQEMMHIMQDYSEVVLSIGSSLNPKNIDVFCQVRTHLSVIDERECICL